MKTILTTLSALLLSAPLFAQPLTAYSVSFMLGESFVKPVGTVWQPLKIGSTLALGDSLRTGDETRLELTALSRDILKVGPGFCGVLNAGLVAALTPAKRASAMSVLMQGDRTNNMQSPTAIAAIRGKAADGDTSAEVLTGDGQTDNAQTGAKTLLDEAVRLRDQAVSLLDAGNESAAAATLEQAENLTQRALTMLEE
jgi:hypothetical protein